MEMGYWQKIHSPPPAVEIHHDIGPRKEKVCEITKKILSDCGYKVIMAQSGEDALDLWEKNKSRVDLLLTDIVLPGISGLQLSQKLRASKPGLKVIYMSGYSDDVIAHHGILDNDISFIQKPFTSMVLTKKIRDVLFSSSGTAANRNQYK